MIYCPKCQTQLVESANYCHHCGNRVDNAVSFCPKCQKRNPADASRCYNCDHPLKTLDLNDLNMPRPYSMLTLNDADILEDELKSMFFRVLREQIDPLNPEKYTQYLEMFYTKNFNKTVDRRTQQLAEQTVENPVKNNHLEITRIEKNLEYDMEGLAQYHIIHNCPELLSFKLPKQILKYEQANSANIASKKVSLREMIADYLDLGGERLRVYHDFIKMPEQKLKNATLSFLQAGRNETIFFICDLSLLGNCRDGFAMTEFGIYWKPPMDKPKRIFYHQLQKIERKRNYLSINGHFFNVNPSMNVKMMMLLNKLRRIYT
jgi:hypothetical protein